MLTVDCLVLAIIQFLLLQTKYKPVAFICHEGSSLHTWDIIQHTLVKVKAG